jgi:hypothetical protein
MLTRNPFHGTSVPTQGPFLPRHPLPMKYLRVLLLSLVSLAANLRAADRPNIIVILADDFGVGDIQAHYPNNKIPTHILIA